MHKDEQEAVIGVIASAVLGLIALTVGGALFGGGAGLLFGVPFGALHGLIPFEPWRVGTSAGYFAGCGAMAGAIVGACYMFTGPEEYSWGDLPSVDSQGASAEGVDHGVGRPSPNGVMVNEGSRVKHLPAGESSRYAGQGD